MSRTRHGERTHRTAAPTRLTKRRGQEWYHPCPDLPPLGGNPWPGTIAAIGGDQRRRDQHEARDAKIHGRRRERMHLNRELTAEIGSDHRGEE